MGGLQSTLDPLWTRWSPFGSITGPNRAKAGPPGELFKPASDCDEVCYEF